MQYRDNDDNFTLKHMLYSSESLSDSPDFTLPSSGIWLGFGKWDGLSFVRILICNNIHCSSIKHLSES